MVKALTAVNTFPNAFSFNAGRSAITPASGLGGLAGVAMKPIALGQVRQWRSLLPPSIDVIGVGGIVSGQDILEYRLCGAAAVQIGTKYLQSDNKGVFGVLLDEFIDLVKE